MKKHKQELFDESLVDLLRKQLRFMLDDTAVSVVNNDPISNQAVLCEDERDRIMSKVNELYLN